MSLFVGSIYVNIKKSDLVNAFRKFGPCKVDLKVTSCASLAK